MKQHLITPPSVMIIVAHEDDAILGLGATIVRLRQRGKEIHLVVCTDGRTSHRAVFRTETNPTVSQVAAARKKEMKRAVKILGLPQENLHYLDLPDEEGRVWQNMGQAEDQLRQLWQNLKPSLVYFHYPDAHRDHRAVSQIVLKIINGTRFALPAFQFFIWTKDLAQGRPEADASRVPDLTPAVIKLRPQSVERELKARALHAIASQTSSWPYPYWAVQSRPILDQKFIQHFLDGPEIFIKVLAQKGN